MSNRHRAIKSAKPEPQYRVTMYDTELERLSVERNRSYEILSDIEDFAKSLPEEYKSISDHLLCMLYGEQSA